MKYGFYLHRYHINVQELCALLYCYYNKLVQPKHTTKFKVIKKGRL